jgi:hypothetical protein
VTVCIPAGVDYDILLAGALSSLIEPENFESWGNETPEDTAEYFDQAYRATFPLRQEYPLQSVVMKCQYPTSTPPPTAYAGWNYMEWSLALRDESWLRHASMAWSIFEMDSGVYTVQAAVSGVNCGWHRLRLVNHDTAAVLVNGEPSSVGAWVDTAQLVGVFELESTAEIALSVYHATAGGFGLIHGLSGAPEVYATIQIVRLS